MPGSSSRIAQWAMTAGQSLSDFPVSRAVATAMTSANRCSSVFGRATWTEASVPGGVAECGRGA
eukprot:13430719-Alexandrium_andersonii.AAC.1